MSQPDKHLQDDAEFEEFGDLIANLRAAQTAGPMVEPVEPPAVVWDLIAAATSQAQAPESIADLGSVRTAKAGRATADSSWGRRVAIGVAAAAAVLLVAVPVGLALRGSPGDDTDQDSTAQDDPTFVQLASTELTSLDQQSAGSGDAALLRAVDDLALDITAAAPTYESGFLELWMLKVDDGGEVITAVSLGKLDGSTRYDVPDDIELGGTWLVDISLEVDDGDDAHGGNSVLRGTLH